MTEAEFVELLAEAKAEVLVLRKERDSLQGLVDDLRAERRELKSTVRRAQDKITHLQAGSAPA